MPWINGHDLVREVHKINPDCVFILISGHDDIGYYQQAINLQVFRYLLKPIQITKLVDTIQLAINESSKRRKANAETIYQELFIRLKDEFNIELISEIHYSILERNRSLVEHNIENMVMQTAYLFLTIIGRITLLSQNNAFSLITTSGIFDCHSYQSLYDCCQDIYSKLIPLTSEPTLSKHQSVILQVLKYVENNYMKNIGAREIAEFCEISTGYLSTIFGQTSYGSIPQYITSYRLKEALSLLFDENLSIAEIASNCGFSSANYFSKMFKKQYGFSPSDAREGLPI